MLTAIKDLPQEKDTRSLRGGDTSDTMYRFLSLYRCIALYRMYLMYRAEKRCEHARSEMYRCIAMYRCIDTADVSDVSTLMYLMYLMYR